MAGRQLRGVDGEDAEKAFGGGRISSYPERSMSVAEYHKAVKQWGNLLRTLTRR